ncbi:MAG TPA: hypothetical protein EYH00_05085 [Archaeoglobus profundus]|nr:hypothetical protein [Archaeoglobus profundus]
MIMIVGKVIRVLNYSEFEAEVEEVSVGDIVICGDILAMIVSIYQEEPEYTKYLGELDREELRSFIPDISEGKKIARCLSLCKINLEEPRTAPRIGDELKIVDDKFLREIHYANGELKIPYLITLLEKCKKDLNLIRSLLMRLMKIIPEEKELLEIILEGIEYTRMKGVEL